MTDETSPNRPQQTAEPARARRTLDACADAIRFFTRLSLPGDWGGRSPVAISNGIAAAAPLAGVLIGAAGGAALALSLAVGLPALPAAVFAATAAVALSGALHLDGLTDVADGFGGGRTRERKLEIMRDSSIGTYGAAALALALLARVTLVAALADRLGEAGAFAGLVACATLARPLALLPTVLLDPARDDGVGKAARPTSRSVGVGCGVALGIAIVFSGLGGGLAVALAAFTALAVARLARGQIGGYTGDVCGATAELAEIAALTGLVVAAAWR